MNREKYLLNNVGKYLRELLSVEEQYTILYECIGLEEDEIKEYGFDVQEIKQYYNCKEE